MAVEESNPAATAAYYDDAAISKFYEVCWGGSDIHIGLYASGDETVNTTRTVHHGTGVKVHY